MKKRSKIAPLFISGQGTFCRLFNSILEIVFMVGGISPPPTKGYKKDIATEKL